MDLLDDHSRVLLAARVGDRPTGDAAWAAFCDATAHWGPPAHVMSDNGSGFTGRFFSGVPVDFERDLAALGIRHIRSSPRHPQTCGKLERSHQTTKLWLARQPPAATPTDLQAQLDAWLAYSRDITGPHRPPTTTGRAPALTRSEVPFQGGSGASSHHSYLPISPSAEFGRQERSAAMSRRARASADASDWAGDGSLG